ncbi:MAG: prepilin-type N-terminal cleavage/methylation domain-containing protein [Candidatus Moranbacteria bacterium]|nr:prepilin-type N-terminal cleavage/methylation domain-containing protein [Candidatus Moranbacteria bacterium]
MKNKIVTKKAFTLVEILLVVAIIGILSGVVLVSTRTSLDKSKAAAAITTMSSILPELVTCADDNGAAIAVAPTTAAYACCISTVAAATIAGCDGAGEMASGHNTKWPAILAKTGYDYAGVPTGTLLAGTYVFFATKSGQKKIICDYAANACCEDNDTGTRLNCQ